MSSELFVLLSFPTAVVLVLVYMARASQVFRVRSRMLDEGGLEDGRYKTLPTFAGMCDVPWHWHRWTFKQWDAYARRRLA